MTSQVRVVRLVQSSCRVSVGPEPVVATMGWPDLSRWIWSYVISRLKLFTDLDPSKLELGARSLSVANVEIDKDRVAIPGVLITQFVVEKLTIELTSGGISINASGVNIDALVKSLEPPDLAISRILEQTRTDIEGYGGGDLSGIKSRFADFALAQVKARITDVRATLRYPSTDVRIRLHADQIVMNQKHVIEFESIIITRESCDGTTDSESFSSTSISESESDDDDGMFRINREENRMAQSMFLDNREVSAGTGSLMKSLYFDAQEDGKPALHDRGEEEELGTINRIVLKFSMDPVDIDCDVDCVRLDGFLALQTVVDTLNLMWKTAQRHNETKSSVKSGLKIASLELYESLTAPLTVPVSLTDLQLHDGKLDIGGLNIPNVVHITPLLSGRADGEEIHVDMTLPVSVSLETDVMPFIRNLLARLGEILLQLAPPPEPRPTPIHINLPEFRLAIGSNFTLLIFPESLSNTTFTLREVVLTASEGQMLIRNLECCNIESTGAFKNRLDEVRVRLSSGFFDELHDIGVLLFGDSSPPETDTGCVPTQTWAAVDLPNTYWKVLNLLIEDSGRTLMHGDMEVRTVDFDADFRASLELDHKNLKTMFEISAYSNDGLKSIESSINFFDFDVFLDKHVETDNQATRSASGGNQASEARYMILPRMRSKLDFGNGIRLHFPDRDNSVFMISLDIVEAYFADDVGFTLVVPGLFVKLEDRAGDISLLKMEQINVSHSKGTASRPSTSITARKAALATCPDTYSLLTKLPALVLPPPLTPQFNVDPDPKFNIFEDVSQVQFTAEKLSKESNDDGALTSDSIEIRENYMAAQSQKIGHKNGNDTSEEDVLESRPSEVLTRLHVSIALAQWQMFDGFDLSRTRDAIGQAIDRIETAAAEANDFEKEFGEDSSDKNIVADFMYNSLFVVAQSGRGRGLLRDQVAEELGGTGPEGYARSSEPKLALALRKTEIEQLSFSPTRSRLSISVKDGKVSDDVPTSAFSHLVAPMGHTRQAFLTYTQETVGSDLTPEIRVKLAMEPLHLQLDQDTVEFMNRFFQFDGNEEVAEEAAATSSASAPSVDTFIQRFDFSELPLKIDYTPKKVDYKSLRSGAAAELVNLFIVKGAKLTLKSCVLHGINGWDRLFHEIFGFWGPDIRANQLTGLLSGFWPVRKALRLGEGFKTWAIMPMQSRRTGQVVRGAGLLVRRTMDELLRLRSVWLDSAEQALGGDAEGLNPSSRVSSSSAANPESGATVDTAENATETSTKVLQLEEGASNAD